MTAAHTIPKFKTKTYKKAPELGQAPVKKPFVIVGAGPIGLALALDMALKGHAVTLLSTFDFIPHGSKAICFAKQSLDIFDRLGIGERVRQKGVIWNVGKIFWRDQRQPLYEFDLLPLKDQRNPAFVNLQQYYVEDFLVDALEALPNVDLRWGHSVSDIKVIQNSAKLTVSTRDGDYQLEAQYVLACDGYKSSLRQLLKLDFNGRIFEDNFLIADIRFPHKQDDDTPAERWFWFDPPFCKGGTSLLHKQADNVWRCDFQLGWDIDREAAVKPENVEPYVRGLLGNDVAFEQEWYSIYTFQCRRMERFVHGPVIFVGDSAHLVSPFGARGANSGLADAENIAWKLDKVIRGEAGKDLIESYNTERVMGADENIRHSSRSTDFMTPKNNTAKAFRNAVLKLSRRFEFARPFINSGRLSKPTPYYNSPLSTADRDEWQAGPAPGFCCIDAPISLEQGESNDWLLAKLGNGFTLLHFGHFVLEINKPEINKHELNTITILQLPDTGLAAERYDALNGATYLIRPDQVVAARWKRANPDDIQQALQKAHAQ